MLRQENEHLCSKLDTVTAYLRAQHPTMPAVADLLDSSNGNRMQAPAASLSINKQPGKVGKVAKGREVLLVFEGDLNTCDRSVNRTCLRHSLHSWVFWGWYYAGCRTIVVWPSLQLTYFAQCILRSVLSTKLLHFKRLLHRRLQSRLSPSEEDMNTLMHVLVAVHKISPPEPWERIRVQVGLFFCVYIFIPHFWRWCVSRSKNCCAFSHHITSNALGVLHMISQEGFCFAKDTRNVTAEQETPILSFMSGFVVLFSFAFWSLFSATAKKLKSLGMCFVQAACPVSEESAALLRREIASLVSFTQGIELSEKHVTVVELNEEAEVRAYCTDRNSCIHFSRLCWCMFYYHALSQG